MSGTNDELFVRYVADTIDCSVCGKRTFRLVGELPVKLRTGRIVYPGQSVCAACSWRHLGPVNGLGETVRLEPTRSRRCDKCKQRVPTEMFGIKANGKMDRLCPRCRKIVDAKRAELTEEQNKRFLRRQKEKPAPPPVVCERVHVENPKATPKTTEELDVDKILKQHVQEALERTW